MAKWRVVTRDGARFEVDAVGWAQPGDADMWLVFLDSERNKVALFRLAELVALVPEGGEVTNMG